MSIVTQYANITLQKHQPFIYWMEVNVTLQTNVSSNHNSCVKRTSRDPGNNDINIDGRQATYLSAPNAVWWTNNKLKDNTQQSITQHLDYLLFLLLTRSTTFVEEPQLSHWPDWLRLNSAHKTLHTVSCPNSLIYLFLRVSVITRNGQCEEFGSKHFIFPLIYLFCMCVKALKQNLQVLARNLV